MVAVEAVAKPSVEGVMVAAEAVAKPSLEGLIAVGEAVKTSLSPSHKSMSHQRCQIKLRWFVGFRDASILINYFI